MHGLQHQGETGPEERGFRRARGLQHHEYTVTGVTVSYCKQSRGRRGGRAAVRISGSCLSWFVFIFPRKAVFFIPSNLLLLRTTRPTAINYEAA